MSLAHSKVKARALHICLVQVCSMLAPISTDANEGEWRWRLSTYEDRVYFALAETDMGTDNYASPRFSCKRASGKIEISGAMDEKMRWVIGDVIRRGKDPWVVFLPESKDTFSRMQPSFSDIDDWMYAVDLPADTRTFDEFKHGGRLQFMIDKALISLSPDTKVGLENFDQFQNACKASPRQR